MTDARWIGVDWGSSALRAWLMRGGQAVARARSDDGAAGRAPEAFESALRAAIGPWLSPDGATRPDPTPVVACGMVGARGAWREAAYLDAPTPPFSPGAATVFDAGGGQAGLRVAILPGVRQSDPPDVMRGEETQIGGFLALQPDFDGVLCLPGTHTKWVRISAGEICHFQTAMTGELFALLGSRSSIAAAVASGGDDAERRADAFADAVDETRTRPERLASALFRLRAADLVTGRDPAAAARLSGLLIGAELAATKPYWLGQNVVILAGAPMGARYQAALAAVGAGAGIADVEAATLSGLRAALAELGA